MPCQCRLRLACSAPTPTPEPATTSWLDAIQRGTQPFLAAAATLGLAVAGVAEEIDQLRATLTGTSYLGLVHGDACPDNGAGQVRSAQPVIIVDCGGGQRPPLRC